MGHTQGPWITKRSNTPSDGGWDYAIGADGNCIAECFEVVAENDKRVDAKANARLMAAAPDMLEALENIENDDEHMPPSAWALIQTAITKARGAS